MPIPSIRPLRALPVLLLATMLACRNTADGVQKDAAKTTEKMAEAGAEAGDAISGGAKTVDVKTALLADSLVTGADINVDTDHESRTVTLSGEVASAAMRARAEQVAKDNATGYSVVNNLTVPAR
ncbi:BON domain-containing protein [Gemmatimonas sp.]|uniref:BON domain-containing protein n=1 Tax=Gemmatimonas sp. TaxID=1962908 RepID=UPI0025C6352F|nr:BON domain-containing protein [Gemmatimonas sp.]MCA2991109.1 BON domain-containing protein [Gemmatimonas sp.]